MEFITKATRTHIDWILFLATLPLLGAGLLTMDSFAGENPFFVRQLIWIGVSLAAFFAVPEAYGSTGVAFCGGVRGTSRSFCVRSYRKRGNQLV